MLFVRIVFVAKVVEHGDCLDDAFDGLGAKGGNGRRYDGEGVNEMLTQFVIERANAPCLRVHDTVPKLGEGRKAGGNGRAQLEAPASALSAYGALGHHRGTL